MDTNDLLKKAWEAVTTSGVPDHLHEIAFREALAHLRSQASATAPSVDQGQAGSFSPQGEAVAGEAAAKPRESSHEDDGFYSRLANETGVDEEDLRHVLEIRGEGDDQAIQVTQPARLLGKTKADQVRTVVALVGGARRVGFDEDPVSAQAVRDECRRKGCLDDNFSKHIDRMTGFTLADRTRLRLSGTKWIGDFKTAVGKLTGEPNDQE
jgi:hypothetical protein